MLAVLVDGGKLPPFIILKRKTLPKEEFPPGMNKMSNSGSCKLPSDRFGCVCGQFIFAKKGRPMSEALRSGYLD
jgi:hypothetical protein